MRRRQFGTMVELESERRRVLKSLNHDLGGMVDEYDLHTKHLFALPGGADEASREGGSEESASLPKSGLFLISQAIYEHEP